MRPTANHCALLAAALLVGCGGNQGDGRESPGDKREWSILQSLEFETREQRTQQIGFRTIDEYELMSVPREADSRLIWVLLNPSHPPFYKQMPEGNFSLTKEHLQMLVAERRVTSTVEEALRSHLRPR